MIGLSIGPSWLHQAAVAAVSVQRLTVPDLVVVDQPQLNQLQQSAPPPIQLARSTSDPPGSQLRAQSILPPPNNLAQQQQPEAASLINFQDPSSGSINVSGSGGAHEQQQQLLTFECLISYDRKKDKNLIIKWHHDDRVEPIYQWIVELDKISIAPQYKPYILANNSTASQRALQLDWQQQQQQPRTVVGNSTANVNSNNQLLEAGFRLIRPSKELGGKFVSTSVVCARAPDIIRFPTFGKPEEDVASFLNQEIEGLPNAMHDWMST